MTDLFKYQKLLDVCNISVVMHDYQYQGDHTTYNNLLNYQLLANLIQYTLGIQAVHSCS